MCRRIPATTAATKGLKNTQLSQQAASPANTATTSFIYYLPSCVPGSDNIARRYCIHAAASTASASASASSNGRDRHFLRRRLVANAHSSELETRQPQRSLASRAAAASVGGAVECPRRRGQTRQLHSNRGCYGLGLLADAAASNSQPRFENPSSKCRCVSARPLVGVCCVCLACRLSTRK